MELRKTTLVMAMMLAMTSWVGGQDVPTGKAWVELNSECCDFAINPETGDMAGVDPKANTITLYPAEYLSGKNKTVVGPTKVGEGTTSVVYKKYKGKGYFAVVCLKDQMMHLLDAKTLGLVKEVDVSARGGWSAAASGNPDDPYVYYAAGERYKAWIGRVSLETFELRSFAGTLCHVSEIGIVIRALHKGG